MKVFVLGPSRSGKTPFARGLAEALGVPWHGASAWVRARFPGGDFPTREAFVEAITRFALEELKRDPSVSIRHLRGTADLGRPCVLEGLRNPYDFVHAFDPRTDRVVFLRHTGSDLRPTAFEEGLGVIRAYVSWLEAVGMLSPGRVHGYDFDVFFRAEETPEAPSSLDGSLARYLEVLRDEARPARDPGVTEEREGFVHVDLPPWRAHVREEYLYGMDPSRAGRFKPCAVFAASSYVGSAPTFKVLLSDGAVFSYLPVQALVDPERLTEDLLAPEDLTYHDCRTPEVASYVFRALEGPVLAYFKRRDRWVKGRYLCSLDWYTGNDLLHVLALDQGQHALLPSHKVKFGEHLPGFESYKKVRGAWSVGA
ncbi:MAG: hypothetical protein HY909_04930 [Deltaproteobacteria bacterium]|nr:hypothetical protein [Deltaproteobacteria bacterium]